ncbi:MAG: FecR domain-containing protein [Gammaproteobacteria bacterium]
MEGSELIEARAAAWLLKRDGSQWTPSDQEQLTEWLEAATVNRVAFLRLEAGWDEANRLKALGVGLPRGKVPSVEDLESETRFATRGVKSIDTASRRHCLVAGNARKARVFTIAAALLAASVGIWIYGWGPLTGERYATPIGGISSVPLKDGSNVTLNTASRISVRLSKEERRINLAAGEAFFDVAKDPSRPFIVHAGKMRIVAIGTKFSVRRDGDAVRVVVTEGVVGLEGEEGIAALLHTDRDSSATPERLRAGDIARMTGTSTVIQAGSEPEAEDLLSWRSGYVVFNETGLADAVAEFNRYNERTIVIRDPGIAAMRLTGKFRANNFPAFVRLLEESFPVHVQNLPDQIILSQASPGSKARETVAQ